MQANRLLAAAMATVMAVTPTLADHREAPIAALDPKGDVTGVFAFRSYTAAGPTATPLVTFIMTVDGMREPGAPAASAMFDPDVLYEIKIDNNNDAVPDIVFQFKFNTEIRLPDSYTGVVGAGTGIVAPANSPAPVAPGTLIVPAKITSFSDAGLGLRQPYTVTMTKGGISTPITGSGPFYAVPGDAGPRTMDYPALFSAGTYATTTANVKVFAGAVDDPVFGDVGAMEDTFNLRSIIAPGVLSPAQDASLANVTSDSLSGFAANAVAVEVPVSLLTRTGAVEAATSTAATLGIWGTTSRYRLTTRRAPLPAANAGTWNQIQRQGNPLINAWLIPLASKDRFSMDLPANDSQFVAAFTDPGLARFWNAATAGGIPIPTPPRVDLLPLLIYSPPIAAPGTAAGPVADMLRLNTGLNATSPATASRLGLLGGDPAGYPNGRRLFDDVYDVNLRLVNGFLVGGAFAGPPTSRLGDGVNVNDTPFRTSFPYLGNAPSGRDRRHIDPSETGCTAGAGAPCSP